MRAPAGDAVDIDGGAVAYRGEDRIVDHESVLADRKNGASGLGAFSSGKHSMVIENGCQLLELADGLRGDWPARAAAVVPEADVCSRILIQWLSIVV